jgi:UDP-N-acetylmuramate--alanine ligase
MQSYNGKTYFFCGVGGSGMSALAKMMQACGAAVYGSDRNYDAGRFPDLYNALVQNGVTMYPQDGTGITDKIDYLVVSSAIEPSIPDVAAAQKLNIPIIKRAELLAEICNVGKTITVGGTNGKSTVTAMIGHVLYECGQDPTIINGGGMLNFDRHNAVIGQSDRIVAETDESDGTITNFHADIAVLTNISEDHKSMDELLDIFRLYLSQAKTCVLNMDCPNVTALSKNFPNAVTYSMDDYPDDLRLLVPGAHNKSNAMAAMAVAKSIGLNEEKIIKALASFQGVVSRLEVVGHKNDITVIDDFGHNPDKIAASIKTLKEEGRRLIVMYQPHGFKPTRDQKDSLIDVFSTYLDSSDLFYMPDILYFGGTVDKDISSADIIDVLKNKGMRATYIPNKDDIQTDILSNAKSGDIICIMGARDDSLRQMARDIFENLPAEQSFCTA